MTRTRTWGRAAVATAAALTALLASGQPAQADPPPDWGGGIEYDFGGVSWTHQGKVVGAPGNWHTGWFNVEEDDDGITGTLNDWRCPPGVTRPTPDAYTDPACSLKRSRWINSAGQPISSLALSTFDQARNRLTVHGDFAVFDSEDLSELGTVRIDVVLKGLGSPETTIDESGQYLEYMEYFTEAKAWGRVDGRRVRGAGVQQEPGVVGFWLDGYVRTG